jgi:hypothetical protein
MGIVGPPGHVDLSPAAGGERIRQQPHLLRAQLAFPRSGDASDSNENGWLHSSNVVGVVDVVLGGYGGSGGGIHAREPL